MIENRARCGLILAVLILAVAALGGAAVAEEETVDPVWINGIGPYWRMDKTDIVGAGFNTYLGLVEGNDLCDQGTTVAVVSIQFWPTWELREISDGYGGLNCGAVDEDPIRLYAGVLIMAMGGERDYSEILGIYSRWDILEGIVQGIVEDFLHDTCAGPGDARVFCVRDNVINMPLIIGADRE